MKQLKSKPSQFQEAYEIEYESEKPKRHEIYFYLKNEDYFNFLNEGWVDSYSKDSDSGKDANEMDEEGFITVNNKKKPNFK